MDAQMDKQKPNHSHFFKVEGKMIKLTLTKPNSCYTSLCFLYEIL